jgi:maltose alpha-D-glucosyltransferase/alpha-amylase
VNSAYFAAMTPLPETGGSVVIAEVEVSLDGRRERFGLPCATVDEADAITPLPSLLALGRFRRGRRVGFITDAFASDAFAHGIVAALRAGATIPISDYSAEKAPGNAGELRFVPTSLLERTPLPRDAEIRRFSVEQSNSSLVIGDAIVIKLIRRLMPDIHPEVEMTRHLTEAGLDCIASLLGHAERVGPDGTPTTLLIAQSFVRNQGDGWAWTLDWLRRAVSESEAGHAEPGDPFAGYLGFAAAIGRRLAQVHAALAMPSDNPAFTPEPATTPDVAAWAASAIASLERALDAIARRDNWESAEAAALAQSLIARRELLLEAVRRLRSADGALLKTRVHGDFHLGQVLVAQGDAVIVDFEGEPARGLAERRARISPMKDVAGLLRSFDYAAEMLPLEFPRTDDVPSAARRRTALEIWRVAATTAFLDAYRAMAEAQPHPWIGPSGDQDTIDIFLIDKVAYEIGYEIANRPTWLQIPLRGLDRLAQRLLG